MAKPELGTKRLCGACGAKFYDLAKSPIVCPKCGTVFEVVATAARARPEPVAKAEEAEVAETQDAEFVSLEEADAEAEGAAKGAPGADDVEEDESLDDDETFIVPEEEEDEDVSDIIGSDIEDEEES